MYLDALTLSARDLRRARAFYTGKLGFPVLEEREGRSFVVDAGNIRLRLDAEAPHSTLSAAEPRLSFMTRELKARCALLRDLGVSVEGPKAIEGGLMAELADPDGHPIVLKEVC